MVLIHDPLHRPHLLAVSSVWTILLTSTEGDKGSIWQNSADPRDGENRRVSHFGVADSSMEAISAISRGHLRNCVISDS